MSKDEPHRNQVAPMLPPELLGQVAAAHEAFRNAGVSIADVGAAVASMSSTFAKITEATQQLTHEHLRSMLRQIELNDSLRQLGLEMELYRLERKAQQRAQLVLLLAFVLLSLLVSLL